MGKPSNSNHVALHSGALAERHSRRRKILLSAFKLEVRIGGTGLWKHPKRYPNLHWQMPKLNTSGGFAMRAWCRRSAAGQNFHLTHILRKLLPQLGRQKLQGKLSGLNLRLLRRYDAGNNEFVVLKVRGRDWRELSVADKRNADYFRTGSIFIEKPSDSLCKLTFSWSALRSYHSLASGINHKSQAIWR